MLAAFVGPLRQSEEFVDDLIDSKVIESLGRSEATIAGTDESFLVTERAFVIAMGGPIITVNLWVAVPVAWASVMLIGAKIVDTTDTLDEVERWGQNVAGGEKDRVQHAQEDVECLVFNALVVFPHHEYKDGLNDSALGS